MLTKKQIRLLGTLSKNIFLEYSFKDIKQLSRENSHSVIQNAIKAFKEQNLITERKIGTSKLYAINTDNDLAFAYLQLFNKTKLTNLMQKTINIIKKEIEKYEFFYSLIIFGSYAEQKQTKDSDMDIAIIIKDKSQETNMKIALNSASNKSLINLDPHIITQEDFLKMLSVNYENLGKEIARKNIPVQNSGIFYRLVKRGIENGFKM